ncbi:MAG: class I SAM-dependent methyltransferase [Oscillospiraceae bacterium]|nr:class I SAM-dependent methyltransferase [Oscillospiraceae bacterium]
MIPLSARLLCCASFVQGEYACDIGTDHALLPAYLIQSGKCKRALATDIKQGPLSAAAQTLKRFNVTSSVSLCCSDGLKSVPDKGITDVVIAGMGGETIRDILADPYAKWLTRGTNLVLQPMTKAEILRSWLAENGFCLIKESAVKDTHLYTVMQARYTGDTVALTEAQSYVGQLRKTELLTKVYIATILERLGKKLEGQRTIGSPEAESTERLIREINLWLKEGDL